jgi:hypothetical protein
MSLTISFVGDIGFYNQILRKTLQSIRSSGTNRVVVLGDVFYPDGLKPDDPRLKLFQSAFRDFKCPISLILGNHDYLGDPRLYLRCPAWEMPNYYYRLCYPNLDLIMLDTQLLEPSYTVNPRHSNVSSELIERKMGIAQAGLRDQQLRWLEEALSQSKARYKIVAGHYHLVSNGIYGRNGGLLEILLPLFRRYRVDAYMCGHEHNNQHQLIQDGDYAFHQFVIGSSAGSRPHFQPRSSGFFAIDPCHLQLKLFPNCLLVRFVNAHGRSIHSVKIDPRPEATVPVLVEAKEATPCPPVAPAPIEQRSTPSRERNLRCDGDKGKQRVGFCAGSPLPDRERRPLPVTKVRQPVSGSTQLLKAVKRVETSTGQARRQMANNLAMERPVTKKLLVSNQPRSDLLAALLSRKRRTDPRITATCLQKYHHFGAP